ncbi:MAG: O-antigen ligase family protein [Thermoleophilia bacterium]|nr:O-antigen ligase family protein [Thermoleophilia bacterium]
MNEAPESPTANMDFAAGGREGRRSHMAALWTLVLLVAGTIAYPDTFVYAALRAGSLRISPLGLLFAIATPAVLWRLWICRNRQALSPQIIDLMLAVYIAFITIRGMAAASNANQLGLVLAFAGYVLLVYYGSAVVGQAQRSLRIMFLTVVVMGVAAAAYGLIEFALERNILYGEIIKESVRPFPGEGYHRIGSLLGQPVVMGAFMVQTIPFVIYFFIRSSAALTRFAWGAAAVAVFLALIVTYSKGAWITAALLIVGGLAWMTLRRPPATRRLILLMGAVALAAGMFTASFYNTVHAGTLSKARTSESISPRTYMWSKAPATFMANPLIGAGLWKGGSEIHRVSQAPDRPNRPIAIDNMYLTVLIEQGLFGALLGASVLVLFGIHVLKLLKKGGTQAGWAWPLAVCMLVTIVNGLTFDILMVWPTMVVFWLASGMVRALGETARQAGQALDSRVCG